MVSKLVTIGLLLAVSCFGQSGAASTSIYQNLVNNATASSTYQVINIGQVSHLVNMYFTSNPPFTCNATNAAAYSGTFQYSYDNIAWYNFGSGTQTVATTGGSGLNSVLILGNGGYPFVRLSFTAPGTACRVTINYTGSSAPTTTSTGYYGSYLYSSVTGVGSIPATAVGAATDTNLGPVFACQQISVNAVAAGHAVMVNNGGAGGVGVCNISATSTGTATIQLLQGNSDCSVTSKVMSQVINLSAGSVYTFGSGLGLLSKTSGETAGTAYVCAVVTGTTTNIQIGYTLL